MFKKVVWGREFEKIVKKNFVIVWAMNGLPPCTNAASLFAVGPP